MSHKLTVTALLMSSLFLAPSAYAAPAIVSHSTPVNFTLYPGTVVPVGAPEGSLACPSLQAVVTGTGESFTVFKKSTNNNGTVKIDLQTIIHGTATDNLGGNYRFNYANHTKIIVPGGVFPAEDTVVDHFNLVGLGQAAGVRTSFAIVFTIPYLGADPIVKTVIRVKGDPDNCDPL